MVDKETLARKQLWLWLLCAWTIIPALTVLPLRRFGDYSIDAIWRWAFLILWTLALPTASALRLHNRVRQLRRDVPSLPEATITGLLAPGWQILMAGLLSVLAATALVVYYDQ